MNPQIQELRVNGVPDAGLSALDRGLHYGDGLFETIACLKGRPRFLPLHLERLEFGCERLRITTANLEDTQAEVLAMATGVERAVLKVIVTAGEALARGYARSGAERATRITIRYSWPHEEPAQLQDGIVVRTLSLRLGENPRLAGLKHSNRLEQVLARLELSADPLGSLQPGQAGRGVGTSDVPWDPGFAEGLLYSSSGNLVAATASNVFVVRGGSLLTPRIDQCGVAGVMRRVVLREARQVGVPARECELRAQDVQDAEEIFLTNALTGIRPVRRLDARELTPGPLTRHLQSVLAPLLNEP